MKFPVTAAVLLALLVPASALGALAPAPAPEGLADALAAATGTRASPPARDADLATLVARADARLGIERPADAYDALAHLDPRLAAVAADLLAAVLHAGAERDIAYAAVPDAQLRALVDDEGSPEARAVAARVDVERVRAAAASLAAAVDAARPTLVALAAESVAVSTQAPLPAPLVDVFPVLGIDPIGVANVYPHDYLLSIDLGGDDVYDNNAGGSLIARGFVVGDPSTFGPRALGFTVGGEFEDSQEAYTATLALDVSGDDTYGVYKSPSTVGGSRDRLCTDGPLVRRVVIQGSGSGGIGMLADLGGNDQYRGKTLAQGNGHIAGVGILFDARGEDSYTAIRSSQGSSVIQGVGILVDRQGDDTYDMQAPPGGIWNVDRGRCDDTRRIALGASIVEAVSLFVDGDGHDRYSVAAQALGHVEALGSGTFIDVLGTDDYGGYPFRENAVQRVLPAGIGAAVFADFQ